MLAIAEAFDALTSDRAYRQRRTLDAALAEVKAQAGKQFDPQFSDLLLKVVNEQRDAWQERIDQALKVAAQQMSLASD